MMPRILPPASGCSQVFSFLNAVLHRPPPSIRPSARAFVLAKPSQAKLQAYESALRGSRYFSTCGQDKAGNKRKNRSFPKAAPIPQEKRAAELEAIQKELVTDLGMAQDIASKVLKQAASKKRKSVLSLENCRGWITTLRQLWLDEEGVIQGLTGSPKILTYSAGGREKANKEVLRVLQEAGLDSEQVMHFLQKNPAVLLVLPATLAQKLDRLASMGFPPGSDCGPLLKNPRIIHASNDSIVTSGMHGTKAYLDMGRERFLTTNSLEDAIVVCQERWAFEWKSKFDERSLIMETAWKVSGIAGLPAIEDQMCKEEHD
eukprot:gene29517-5866_t